MCWLVEADGQQDSTPSTNTAVALLPIFTAATHISHQAIHVVGVLMSQLSPACANDSVSGTLQEQAWVLIQHGSCPCSKAGLFLGSHS